MVPHRKPSKEDGLVSFCFCYPRGWSLSNQPSFLYLVVYSAQLRSFFTDQRSESGTGMKQSATWDLLRDPLPLVRHSHRVTPNRWFLSSLGMSHGAFLPNVEALIFWLACADVTKSSYIFLIVPLEYPAE